MCWDISNTYPTNKALGVPVSRQNWVSVKLSYLPYKQSTPGASVETGPRCSCLELGGHILHNEGQTYPESLVYNTNHQQLINIQIIYNSHSVPHSSMVLQSQGMVTWLFFFKNLSTSRDVLKDFKLYSK